MKGIKNENDEKKSLVASMLYSVRGRASEV